MAMSEVGTAYVAATSAAVGISIGLTQLIPRLKGVAPGTRAILTRLVPFAAVGSASVVNVAAMRWRELVDGINVYRPATSEREPEAVGQSAVAGRRAVATTALSRVLTNCGPFSSGKMIPKCADELLHLCSPHPCASASTAFAGSKSQVGLQCGTGPTAAGNSLYWRLAPRISASRHCRFSSTSLHPSIATGAEIPQHDRRGWQADIELRIQQGLVTP